MENMEFMGGNTYLKRSYLLFMSSQKPITSQKRIPNLRRIFHFICLITQEGQRHYILQRISQPMLAEQEFFSSVRICYTVAPTRPIIVLDNACWQKGWAKPGS